MVFTPVVALFSVFNFVAGNQVIGALELTLALITTAVLLTRKRLSLRTLEAQSSTQIALLTYAFLFFPAVGDNAYLWIMALPFFISFLLGTRRSTVWIVGFGLISTATYLATIRLQMPVYWKATMAPYLLFDYCVVSIIAYFFGLQRAAHIRDLQQLTIQSHSDARALVESENRYHALLKSSMHAIVITDEARMIIDINDAFETVTHFHRDDVVGEKPKIFNSEKHSRAFYRDLWRQIADRGTWQGRLWTNHKDGTSYPVELSISSIKDSNSKVVNYVGIFADISEQMATEKQVREAQTLEALGTLTGGIAHEFNNILASITGNLYLAKEHITAPETREMIEGAEHASWQAATMVKSLLTFSRKDRVRMRDLDLRVVLSNAVKLINTSLPNKVAIQTEFGDLHPYVRGDQSLLKQLLLGLLNNAMHAVKEVDTPQITVGLQTIAANSDPTTERLLPKDTPHVCISVQDNGCGIAAEQAPHLFEPFFTTKDQGEGSGLGLAMIYGATKTHSGFVEFQSTVGVGSHFKVYIPLLNHAPKVAQETHREPVVRGHDELILLVDDEKMVREAMAKVVRTMGYTTITCEDGVSAFETFSERHESIALVLTDVVMPRCGGAELAAKILEIDPSMPVIFLTGYDREQVLADDARLSGNLILSKPVDFELLRASLSTLIPGQDPKQD